MNHPPRRHGLGSQFNPEAWKRSLRYRPLSSAVPVGGGRREGAFFALGGEHTALLKSLFKVTFALGARRHCSGWVLTAARRCTSCTRSVMRPGGTALSSMRAESATCTSQIQTQQSTNRARPNAKKAPSPPRPLLGRGREGANMIPSLRIELSERKGLAFLESGLVVRREPGGWFDAGVTPRQGCPLTRTR